MNTKIIEITFNHFHNTVSCNIANISHIAINQMGIIQGSADSISAKDIELRDFLKSLFDLEELFKAVKAENEIKKYERCINLSERKNNILERELEEQTRPRAPKKAKIKGMA